MNSDLESALKPNQVIAMNKKGKATIFDVTVYQPVAALERWGWKVIKTYLPADVKTAQPKTTGKKTKDR